MSTLAGFTQSRDLSESHIAYRHMVIEPKPPLGVSYGSASGEPPVRAAEASLADGERPLRVELAAHR